MLINQDFEKLSSEFNDPSKTFKYVVKRLHQPYLVEMPVNGVTTLELAKKIDFDKVAAIESRGFVFASTVSFSLSGSLLKPSEFNIHKSTLTLFKLV